MLFAVLPKIKKVQLLTDEINTVSRENLTGIRVVRAFNAEEYQEGKFENVNNKLTKQQIFNQKSFSVLQPTMNMVMHTFRSSLRMRQILPYIRKRLRRKSGMIPMEMWISL